MLQKDQQDKSILYLFTTADGQADEFIKQTKTMILGCKSYTSVQLFSDRTSEVDSEA